MTKQTIITTAAVTTGAVVLISIIAIAYQALVVVPREQIEAEAKRYEQERRLEALAADRREDRYNSCLVDAQSFYTADWNGHCELIGKEPDCSLPTNTALIFETRKEKAEEQCLAIYKAN